MKKIDEYEYPNKKHFIKSALGYNRGEVDLFLRQLAENPLPSEKIKNKSFSSSAMGYDKQDVKFYLQELAAYRYNIEHADEQERKRLESLAKVDLAHPDFKVAFRGYNPCEIDEFIQKTHTPEEIYEAHFTKQFRGYNTYQVDFYLDAWIQKLKGNL
ncbi:MAG: DivIVA domain-containing protein [Streptococcaceae bacterium]|nr:DivIVA domain-containing protein [Streptococcaceae bacterium]